MATKQLTKSRFTRGVQCPKLMWLATHEPAAPELVPSPDAKYRFAVGDKVGALARSYVPGGVLIERNTEDFLAPIEATKVALASQVPAIYEAVIQLDDMYCAIDILERTPTGWNIIEVKSSTKVKEEYLIDVAVQAYIAIQSGLKIEAIEVMTLSRECRFPDLTNLFVRHHVKDDVAKLMPSLPAKVASLKQILNGDVEPKVKTGQHCSSPYECPFTSRCHGELPEHHVSTLYRVTYDKVEAFTAAGVLTVADIPDDAKLNKTQEAQRQAVRTGEMLVLKGIAKDLAKLEGPLGYLDFETVMPAVPVWDGFRPYDQCPAQFSMHVEKGSEVMHFEWIATTTGDPRRPLAEALIKACASANHILSYNAAFEKNVIKAIAEHLPDLSDALRSIFDRIYDLLPIVRNNVYHPKFYGSFSIKAVLPALCPDLSYKGLAVSEGGTAARLLEVIMTLPDQMTEAERAEAIQGLLAYCKLDTYAMVRLLKRLRELAA